jgi:glucokinase
VKIVKEQNEKIYLGLDIGGSSIKYGWGNCKLGLLESGKVELKDNTLNSLRLATKDILAIADKKIGLKNIKAIGIGTPGTIDLQASKIVGVNPNLPEWTNLKPDSLIPNELGLEVFVDNDANLMALAEAAELPECNHVIGITIGSGIGCGFIIYKQIYHGAHGYAMELGHTTIQTKGVSCNCGKTGCLETYASVNGLINLIRNDEADFKINSLRDVLELAKAEKKIQAYLDDSISYLSASISNLAIILDADAIIIGGGAVDAVDYPFEQLRKKIIDNLPDIFQHKIIVQKAKNGNLAGTLGAVYLAEKGNIVAIKE